MEKIYSAIATVISEIGPIAKSKQTDYGNKYNYRGIDELQDALNPVLGRNKVIILPRVTDAEYETRPTRNGTNYYCRLKVNYTLFAEDGSSIETLVIGEAMDSADKLINKAMTAAFKILCFQLFCIPINGEMHDVEKDDPNEPLRQGAQILDFPPPEQPQEERFATPEEWKEVQNLAKKLGKGVNALAKQKGYTLNTIPYSFLLEVKKSLEEIEKQGGNA